MHMLKQDALKFALPQKYSSYIAHDGIQKYLIFFHRTCTDMWCAFPLVIFLPGFNSNINLPGREDCGSAPTSPSLQLQDKNANNHSLHSPSPISVENGNQISNGNNPTLYIYTRSSSPE